MAVFLQLLGLIGSGKSFIAEDLAKAVNGHRLPFAKEVYRLAEDVLGRPVDKTRPEERELLRLVGTTWGRDCSRDVPEDILAKLDARKPAEWGSQDIWVRLFLKDCASMPADVSVFNDDTRFANELLILLEKGFIPVFVACTPEKRCARLRERGEMFDANDATHESEELINRMCSLILAEYLLPVVWNDDRACMPRKKWIRHRTEFKERVVLCGSNAKLACNLGWNQTRIRSLCRWIEQQKGVAANVQRG